MQQEKDKRKQNIKNAKSTDYFQGQGVKLRQKGKMIMIMWW